MENKNEPPRLCECGDCGGKANHLIGKYHDITDNNTYVISDWLLVVECMDCKKRSGGTRAKKIVPEHYFAEFMEWNANQEHIILSRTAGVALPGRRASI